jgi:cytochrome c556
MAPKPKEQGLGIIEELGDDPYHAPAEIALEAKRNDAEAMKRQRAIQEREEHEERLRRLDKEQEENPIDLEAFKAEMKKIRQGMGDWSDDD